MTFRISIHPQALNEAYILLSAWKREKTVTSGYNEEHISNAIDALAHLLKYEGNSEVILDEDKVALEKIREEMKGKKKDAAT